MKRTRFARLAVLLCVAAMLVLQGCGGDSDDSAEQDLQAQIDMLMTERDAAVTAQAAAEAAQATAMAAQTAATAAQAAAEMERDTANTAKGAAEEAARVAQQAQMDAETAQMDAETAQMAVDAMLSQANVDLAAAKTAQMDAETAQMAAEAAQATAEAAATAAMAAQATAEAAATAAMTAQATAEAASAAAMTAQATAEAAQAKAEMERDDALAALEAAQEAEGEKQDTIDEATRKETNTRAKGITKAMVEFYDHQYLDKDGKPTAADGTLLTAEQIADAEQMYRVPTEAPSALAVANTAADGLVITPVEKPLEFRDYKVDANMVPPAIDGWQATTMKRRNNADAATQLIYSWTDIEMATMATFGAMYGRMVTLTNDNINLAKSSEFPSLGDVEQPYNPTDVDFVGTFDGVDGTFGCPTGSECGVQILPNGKLALGATARVGLVFTPDDASDMVVVSDDEYLYLGFWLEQPDSAGNPHMFAAWAGGSDLYRANSRNADGVFTDTSIIPDKIGRAKYEGPAAGKYATRNLAKETSEIGIFTATAELTVDFEAPNPGDATETTRAPGRDGTVGGTISNFVLKNGEANNWRVNLMPADLSQIGGTRLDDDADPATPTVVPTLFDAGTTARIGSYTTPEGATEGQWQAQLFGNERDDGDPNAVAGRFDVDNDHATLSGAFGAYNTADE